MHEDMAPRVVVNKKSVQVTVTGDGSKESIKIAPGEGKIPTNMMREDNMDVKAFPRHHLTGKFGLNHPREFKLSPLQYFNQRLLNEDERFSTDSFYVFMAASYLERHALESQINIAGVKGQAKSMGNGQTKVSLNDMYDVFKKVKGTPKYWQVARNELVAKVKQLGPFHIFYTFSCGEMRWPEVYLTLLREKKYEISKPQNYDGHLENMLVEGKPLWKYVNEDMSCGKHELFRESTFLITIMFDEKVKSFIKNILMANGKDQVKFRYYNYRVEFQARGNICFNTFRDALI